MLLKSLLKFILLYTLIVHLYSCSAPKNMYYVKDLVNQVQTIDSLKQLAIPKIQIGDRISIVVSCADPNQTSFLNPFSTQNPGTNGFQNTIGYLVDSLGFIDFPLLGRTRVLNLNSQQASNNIKEGLKKYFKDPYVYVSLSGKVFVINGRGGYNVQMNNERLTIFEALAQQGSYEPDDKWNEVLVIREAEGKRISTTVDLTNKEILNSHYYYLQNNDLIYVKPGKLNATLRSTNATRSTIGLVTGILALAILLIKK